MAFQWDLQPPRYIDIDIPYIYLYTAAQPIGSVCALLFTPFPLFFFFLFFSPSFFILLLLLVAHSIPHCRRTFLVVGPIDRLPMDTIELLFSLYLDDKEKERTMKRKKKHVGMFFFFSLLKINRHARKKNIIARERNRMRKTLHLSAEKDQKGGEQIRLCASN